MKVDVHRISMADPSDVSELKKLIEDGTVNPNKIVASIGKAEGNGGANDFTRGFATVSFSHLLSSYLGVSPAEVAERVAFVWSGGCEGVLSPHATLFTRDDNEDGGVSEPRLAISVQRTRDLLPEEVGRMVEVTEVADAVRKGLEDLDVDGAEVHYVQVKGPLLTPAAVADAKSRGAELVTTDPNGSKPFARGASALGVALGLGEVKQEQITEGIIGNDMNIYSEVASTSAGGEIRSCEVIIFANSSKSSSDYKIGHGSLADAIDLDGVRASLRGAGLVFDCEPSNKDAQRIGGVFAKAEAPLDGVLRGHRTTMLSDADIGYERHARAAVGAVIASVTKDARIFVSGGTEHQCPPGEAPIAAIVRAS